MVPDGIDSGIARELVEAFIRLAKGDFSVRMARTYKRDDDDLLALFVNLIGEEIQRLLSEQQRVHSQLEEQVARLSESFLSLAAGDFSARAERSGTGDPIDVLAYLFNNTAAELGEAFETAQRQTAALAAIFDAMVDGVLLLDDQGVVVRANGAIAGLLDHEADALVGRPLVELVASGERELAGGLAEMVHSAPVRHRDIAFKSRGGDTVLLTVNASPQLATDGNLAGIVLTARDERQLRQAREQLQLTDRLSTIGTLAAGVAHEINNPLAFMIANLDFVGEEIEAVVDGDSSESEALAEIKDAVVATRGGAERVRQIVLDLKSFARTDHSAVVTVDLKRVVDSAVNMVRSEIRYRARLVREFGPTPKVAANEGKLLQVLLNLLQNAAQSIPLGAVSDNQIRVVTGTTDDGQAFIEVHDTGCGIENKDLPRIFDAFFTTKDVGQGTGLGLSISHKIIGSMGGTMTVESAVGKGSVFRVVIPAGVAEEARQAGQSTRAPQLSVSKKRILVIDDEPEVGESIRRVLARDHQIDAATNATAAMRLLGLVKYDLILCDIMMPETSGMDLYEQVCKRYPLLVDRIVIMTGGAANTDIRRFLERIGNRRIDKPFDAIELRNLVADLR